MIQSAYRYAYQLDSTSRKEICPRCGYKTFVLYVDESGKSLSPDVGKCDRKDKCNWHYPPKEYFRDKGLTWSAARQPAAPAISSPHIAKRIPQKFVEPDYIKPKIFESTMTREQRNPFITYLNSLFEPHLTQKQILSILIRMGVGTAKQFSGAPIFWQMDVSGRLRTGKVMGYDAKSGKRIKRPFPQIQWVHKLTRNPAFRLQQCFFGSHNLGGNNATIGLFESEKAAVIMALAMRMADKSGRFIPIACGGADGFNPMPDKLRDPFGAFYPLKGRRIILFPDEGKAGLWRERGTRLRGFSREVYISMMMEKDSRGLINCAVEDGDAADDIIIRYIKRGLDVNGFIDILLDDAERNRIV